MVQKESQFDEEYTMLLPGEVCYSCEKKKAEQEEKKKQRELNEKKIDQMWRECMICNTDTCTIL